MPNTKAALTVTVVDEATAQHRATATWAMATIRCGEGGAPSCCRTAPSFGPASTAPPACCYHHEARFPQAGGSCGCHSETSKTWRCVLLKCAKPVDSAYVWARRWAKKRTAATPPGLQHRKVLVPGLHQINGRSQTAGVEYNGYFSRARAVCLPLPVSNSSVDTAHDSVSYGRGFEPHICPLKISF